MKALILALIVTLTISFIPVESIAQNSGTAQTVQVDQDQNQSIKEKVLSWVRKTGYALAIAFAFGIFAKKGWSQIIKRISNRGSIITRELGEFFLSGSSFLNTLDQSIKEDGKLKENSAKELIEAGKEVFAEAQDVVVIIKPKKKSAYSS